MNMGRFFKSLSLVPQGLRHKILVAFCLMSVIPIIVLFLVAVAFIFPETRDTMQRVLLPVADDYTVVLWGVTVLGATVIVALTGRFVVEQIIEPIIRIAEDAKTVAAGDYNRTIAISREDEVGDISNALNQLTLRIKSNMDELRDYGERTKSINLEIHKRVLALQSLLQIGNLISQSADLDAILELVVQKVGSLEEGSCAFLYLLDERGGHLGLKSVHNLDPECLTGVAFEPAFLVVDREKAAPPHTRELLERLGVTNLVTQPITLQKRLVGLLGVGNHREDFVFLSDYLEITTVFARQVAIAVENDALLRKTKALSVTDDLTGLYNDNYIRTRLEEEIKRAIAYQRPCAFLLFDVDAFAEGLQQCGQDEMHRMLKKIGRVLTESVTELDRVGRLQGGRFAVVLPERNKRQAKDVAEQIRQRIEFAFRDEREPIKRLTVSCAVAENPIDGVSAEELLRHAEGAMVGAKAQGRNCVAV